MFAYPCEFEMNHDQMCYPLPNLHLQPKHQENMLKPQHVIRHIIRPPTATGLHPHVYSIIPHHGYEYGIPTCRPPIR